MSEIPEEARQRKHRSEAFLQAEGVRVNLFLPVIETEAEIRKRTKEEVAFRTIALLTVALKGEGLEQHFVDETVEDYDLKRHFTPEELTFINDPTPNSLTRGRFSWRYEAAWTLLWALGFAERLDKPIAICSPATAVQLLVERRLSEFLADARLRTPEEILDQADLIYRYHWAAVDARLRGVPQTGVNEDIAVERHHALNWLIGYNDAEWDDVKTDT